MPATDNRITALATLAAVADGDLLVAVDVSDTTGSDAGTTKRVAAATLATYCVRRGAEIETTTAGGTPTKVLIVRNAAGGVEGYVPLYPSVTS